MSHLKFDKQKLDRSSGERKSPKPSLSILPTRPLTPELSPAPKPSIDAALTVNPKSLLSQYNFSHFFLSQNTAGLLSKLPLGTSFLSSGPLGASPVSLPPHSPMTQLPPVSLFK